MVTCDNDQISIQIACQRRYFFSRIPLQGYRLALRNQPAHLLGKAVKPSTEVPALVIYCVGAPCQPTRSVTVNTFASEFRQGIERKDVSDPKRGIEPIGESSCVTCRCLRMHSKVDRHHHP